MKELLISLLVVALVQVIQNPINKKIEKSKSTANKWDDYLWMFIGAVVSGLGALFPRKKSGKK